MNVVSNFLLKAITSTAVGGRASRYVEVKKESELERAVQYAESRKLNKFIIGDATNIIPADEGFDGLIIRNQIKKFEASGDIIFLGAGNSLLKNILKLNKLGRGGFEKMAGIPGTVGGAVYGCAGAYGQEIKDRLLRVKIFDPASFWRKSQSDKAKSQRHKRRGADTKKQRFKWLTNKQCEFSYRDSIFKKHKDWIIVGAEFRTVRTDSRRLQKISAEVMELRSRKYPPSLKCPGSFFKNILIDSIKPAFLRRKLLAQIKSGPVRNIISNGANKIPAAYFLEQVGAKGMKFGQIAVADYHANLIYNAGGGKAEDIKKLAVFLKTAVRKKFGVELEEEVQYL